MTSSEILAMNLSYLIRKHDLLVKDIAVQAGVGTTTLYRAVKGLSVTTYTIDSIASAFDMQGWQLLKPLYREIPSEEE